MSITRPTQVPNWATGGSIVDPGSGKQVTGWVPSEKPPAQYMNWIQNLQGQWAEHWKKSSTLLKLTTLVPTATVGAGLDSERPYAIYSPTAERLLVLVSDQPNTFVYQSDAGFEYVGLSITGSGTSYAMDGTAVSQSGGLALDEGGQRVMAANGTSVFTNTSVAAAGFSAATSPTNNVLGLHYVSWLDLWIAGVQDVTNGVETSDDFGSTWTQRSLAQVCYDATDDGSLIAIASVNGSVYTSTDGSTWTARSTSLSFCNRIQYHTNHGFIAYGDTGSSSEIVQSDDGITWQDFGLTANNLSQLYDVVLMDDCVIAFGEEPSGSAATSGMAVVTYDAGTTWEPASTVFPAGASNDANFFAIAVENMIVISQIPDNTFDMYRTMNF